MSVQAMTWAMEQQLVTDPHACSVLIALANHADRDGTGSFPSVETVRLYTKLSERTIRTKLADLEGAGIIRRGNQAIAAAHIDRADRRPVVWDLAMELGVQDSHPVQENGVQQPHPENSTGCSSRPNGVQLTSPRGARVAPKPSLNRPEPEKEVRSPSGSRLPQDWNPSEDDLEFARTTRPDLDLQAEVEKFRDYWHGVAGAAARKADWPATWRNWIRRAAAPKPAPGHPVAGSSAPAAPQRDWREPVESPLERELAWIRQQHGYGALGEGEDGNRERDRLLDEARRKHEAEAA